MAAEGFMTVGDFRDFGYGLALKLGFKDEAMRDAFFSATTGFFRSADGV